MTWNYKRVLSNNSMSRVTFGGIKISNQKNCAKQLQSSRQVGIGSKIDRPID